MRVVVLLDPSIFIGNEMEDGNVRFSIKKKGPYSMIAFCVNLAQLFILSYLTTPWKMFLSKKTLYTVLGQLLMNILILFIQLRDLFSNEKVTHYGMGGK